MTLMDYKKPVWSPVKTKFEITGTVCIPTTPAANQLGWSCITYQPHGKTMGSRHFCWPGFPFERRADLSGIVKSKFGYHIIQMVNRAGDDAVVRHILLIPKVTETEISESVGRLDTIRKLSRRRQDEIRGSSGQVQ